MAARTKKPEPTYKLLKEGPRKTIVRKFVEGSQVAEYIVEDGTCTCPGWFHRQDCKHVQMVYSKQFQGGQEPHGEAEVSASEIVGVSLPEARQIVTEILTHFEDDVHRMWKDEYVKNDSGQVVEIQFCWIPKRGQENDPPKIEGVYKGVKVTMTRENE